MPLPVTYVYPQATELKEIEQDLVPEMEADDPLFFKELFPVETANTDRLEWEQWDNFYGLQQARGLDGMPASVARIGSNRYSTEPGYYGEFFRIDEKELTTRAKFASYTGQVDVTDLVQMGQRFLLQRRIDRQRWLGFELLQTGKYLVEAPGKGYEHRDIVSLETLTMSPALDQLSTAAPFAFILGWAKKGRGTSSKFGPEATCYVNWTTAQNLLGNTNANDLGGRYRLPNGATVNTIDELNSILVARGCPRIAVYDKGWSSGANTVSTFSPFIKDGYGILIGKRTTNTPLGRYRITLNAHNGMQPGPYTIVTNTYGQVRPQDAVLQVDDGHNGGPVIEFPSAVKIVRFY